MVGIPSFWRRPTWLSGLLVPLALLFSAALWLRRKAYLLGWLSTRRLSVPVIVVGNLFVGGTGKTPLVIEVVRFLQGCGRRPGVVSRGYGGTARKPMAVGAASAARMVGEEPILIVERTGVPVWVGRDRVAAAAALLAAHPECDTLVSDDGLQHLSLARDVELVVFDERGVGNGRILPAGPLREPLNRLEQVTAIILHGDFDLGPCAVRVPRFRMRLAGDMLQSVGDALIQRPLSSLRGETVHATAAIGNPGRFFRHLERAGLRVIEHPFPDHHLYGPEDLEFGDNVPLLMTQKDAVKCRAFARSNWWLLPVAAEVETKLLDLVRERIDGCPSA